MRTSRALPLHVITISRPDLYAGLIDSPARARMGTIFFHAIFLFVSPTSFALSAWAFNAPSGAGGRSALSTGCNAPFGLRRCVGVSGVSASHKSLPPTFFMSASSEPPPSTGSRGHVDILYCTGCRWMLRSAYYAQELLTSFQDDLTSVTLIPSPPQSPGGMFFVSVDGQAIWNRKARGRFPETSLRYCVAGTQPWPQRR